MRALKFQSGPLSSRRGAAALDYVLALGVMLPLAAFLMGVGPRMVRRVYEMISLFVTWPFL